MVSGRLRTNCPSDEELIKLGEDLVNWAANYDPEHPHYFWAEWYTSRGFIRAQWKKMIEKDAFRPYYESAQIYISRIYVNGTVNPSIAHRFIRHYCSDVKEEENEEIRYKEMAKAEAAQQALINATPEQQEQLQALLKAMASGQSSALNKAKSNNKSE